MSNLSLTVLSEFDSIIYRFMRNSWAFTIYDVVRLARHNLQSYIGYGEARQYIEKEIWRRLDGGVGSSYLETTKTHNRISYRIFHPASFDVTSYNESFHDPAKKVSNSKLVNVKTQGKAKIASCPVKVKSKTSTKNLRQTDKEGRLTIPVGMLRAFGMKPGSTIFVAARNNNQSGLVLLSKKPGSGILKKIKLGRDLKVRLAAGVLKRSKLDLSNSLPKVSLTERAIVVSPGA